MTATVLQTRTHMRKKSQAEHGVLLVAHGERGGRLNNANLLELADQVRANLGHVEVSAAVLKGNPSLEHGWQQLSASSRMIYPFFMSDGYFVSRILPKKISEAIGISFDELEILAPFGVSRYLASNVISALRWELIRLNRMGERPPVLIAAHGASLDKQSSRRAGELATALEMYGCFGPISCAFLDEGPYLEDVAPHLSPDSIVLPLFNGLGSHAVDDMARIKAECQYGVHFVAPVGSHRWVANLVTLDIIQAIENSRLPIAAQ